MQAILDQRNWAAVPFHFWSVVFFIFGSMVGSFLNVCIHRLPLGQSVVSPPSHCPRCRYAIPWYLNIPLFTWLFLRGRCKNCGAPIAVRYLLVELLTGLVFLACWLAFGRESVLLSVIYGFFIAGLIAATFIDFEHFIIPDEITIGGMVAGFICSLLLPRLHGDVSLVGALRASLTGMAVGAGIVYLIVRLGKLVFGRKKLTFPPDARVLFTETAVRLPGEEILYEELFYRESDTITLRARQVEMADRCYRDVVVQLSPSLLKIGPDEFVPEQVPYLEAVSGEIVLPQEAMGFGDVKFMGAIGAFLGWKAVVFSLVVSSFIGSLVGVSLILLRRHGWSSRLPYGPYIALAAVVWIFGGFRLVEWWFGRF
jgi:leader peptidase (prepilin peptidase)/N-methyltransferase